jgi:ribosomal protein L40E
MMAFADPISFVIIFVGVIVITAIIFGVWLVGTILKVIGRGIVAIFRPTPPPINIVHADHIICPRRICQARNPAQARFCRRCGCEILRGQYASQQTIHG